MVKITEDLIRKKAEHNESIIGTLEELSLHQEDVDKIDNVHNWCKELQILYLQANLISKIENLYKLKKLEYLNLAVNNIEKIENLERCESLTKLDLTLNFIGDLESVCSLKSNIHLRDLYLTGNPCVDFPGYREYVIAQLPQLESLDNKEITRSERIKALQILSAIEPGIKEAQAKYAAFRAEQKERLANVADDSVDDDTFWNSKSEHAPEMRVEMTRRQRLVRGKDKVETKEKKQIETFNYEGRPMNTNRAKIPFTFDDSDPEVFVLDIAVYKYLDTEYIHVDLQPIYVSVQIKEKIFQYVFSEEICVDKSTAKRSQTTGHLVLTMPRVNYKKPLIKTEKKITSIKSTNSSSSSTSTEQKSNYLEVTPADKSLDFSKIVESNKIDPEIPALEYVYST